MSGSQTRENGWVTARDANVRPPSVEASGSLLVLRLWMRLRVLSPPRHPQQNNCLKTDIFLDADRCIPKRRRFRCFPICAWGSVTVLVARQDVEVAQGRGVVCGSTLQNHHPAEDTQTHPHLQTQKKSSGKSTYSISWWSLDEGMEAEEQS